MRKSPSDAISFAKHLAENRPDFGCRSVLFRPASRRCCRRKTSAGSLWMPTRSSRHCHQHDAELSRHVLRMPDRRHLPGVFTLVAKFGARTKATQATPRIAIFTAMSVSIYRAKNWPLFQTVLLLALNIIALPAATFR